MTGNELADVVKQTTGHVYIDFGADKWSTIIAVDKNDILITLRAHGDDESGLGYITLDSGSIAISKFWKDRARAQLSGEPQ